MTNHVIADLDSLDGRWLVPRPSNIDRAGAELVVLDEPVSFWGGFDAETGQVIDRSHPQYGVSLAGKIVAMPGSKGSSGTPGVLGESIRRGTGPVALIISKPDINLVAGSLTATALYGTSCPILLVTAAQFDHLAKGTHEA